MESLMLHKTVSNEPQDLSNAGPVTSKEARQNWMRVEHAVQRGWKTWALAFTQLSKDPPFFP